MPACVTYPGIVGSFSWGAARNAFPDAELHGIESFSGVAEAALSWADCALLPIENSTAGAVRTTWELLEKLPLFIVGEARHRVRHHLLGVRGASLAVITQISSHPQALAQCDVFLSALRGVQLLPSANTAISAREAAQRGDPAFAAIASEEAAEVYGLDFLARDIQTSQVNTTRFVILSRQMRPLDKPNKATITFRLAHRVGALARVLDSFALSGLNMTRIESRPLPDQPFEYSFTADFAGEMDEASLHAALQAASAHTVSLRLLGRYRASGG